MDTISQRKAEQQNADSFSVGEILAYWVSASRTEAMYLGRGKTEDQAIAHARETMASSGVEMLDGTLECVQVAADDE